MTTRPRRLRLRAALAFPPLFFAGCSSPSPPAALSSVRQQVAARSDLPASWPRTDAERAASDEAVRELLAADLTPESAVRIAVLNNRGLRATFESLGVSEADVAAAGRLHNPVFFASARWPDRASQSPDVELSLAGDFLDDLLIPLRRRVARAQLDEAEARVAQAVLDLGARVKEAAYTLEARAELRARLQAVADANEAAAELARRQFAAGDINRLERESQEVSAEEARLDLLRTDAQVRDDRETLNRLLGLAGAETAWKMPGHLPDLPPASPPAAALEDVAQARRLDLAAARADVALAQEAFDLKRKTRLLPATVTLGADTEHNPDGSRVTGPQMEVGLPIFDQGQADLARLEARLRRALDDRDALAAQIGSEVRSARDALDAARQAADYCRGVLLPRRAAILQETLLHYNAMQSSAYELLAAREAEARTERAAIEADRDYWLARVRLERALGQ